VIGKTRTLAKKTLSFGLSLHTLSFFKSKSPSIQNRPQLLNCVHHSLVPRDVLLPGKFHRLRPIIHQSLRELISLLVPHPRRSLLNNPPPLGVLLPENIRHRLRRRGRGRQDKTLPVRFLGVLHAKNHQPGHIPHINIPRRRGRQPRLLQLLSQIHIRWQLVRFSDMLLALRRDQRRPGDKTRVQHRHGELRLVLLAELPNRPLSSGLAGGVDRPARRVLAKTLDKRLGKVVPVGLGVGVVTGELALVDDGDDGGHEDEGLDGGLGCGGFEGAERPVDGALEDGGGVGEEEGDRGGEMGYGVDSWGVLASERKRGEGGRRKRGRGGKSTLDGLIECAGDSDVGDFSEGESVGILRKGVADGLGGSERADGAADGPACFEEGFDGLGGDVAVGAGDENESFAHGGGFKGNWLRCAVCGVWRICD